jgi:cytochrome bd-type quinol oxidase subunit 2
MEDGHKLATERRVAEWAVIFFSIMLVAITVSTFILDQKRNNWVCGPVLIIFEFIAIGFQVAFNVTIWRTTKRNIKFLFAVISFILLTFITWNFINFLTSCS